MSSREFRSATRSICLHDTAMVSRVGGVNIQCSGLVDILSRRVESAPQRRVVFGLSGGIGQISVEGVSSSIALLVPVGLGLSPGLGSLRRTHGRRSGKLLLVWRSVS